MVIICNRFQTLKTQIDGIIMVFYTNDLACSVSLRLFFKFHYFIHLRQLGTVSALAIYFLDKLHSYISFETIKHGNKIKIVMAVINTGQNYRLVDSVFCITINSHNVGELVLVQENILQIVYILSRCLAFCARTERNFCKEFQEHCFRIFFHCLNEPSQFPPKQLFI